ncbi:MAG: lipopolysaccharide heptosyltransferase I [Candidatus Neptunochlamydia sp.]|nr:lipopolysaccharide heptosyltransferase I [Candidatus Neptunochlamydia sp.]
MQILIVKTTSLGDIIQSLPVLAFLLKKFPHAQLDWVVEKLFKELLEAHPNIHQVIPVEMRIWKRNLIKQRQAIKNTISTLRKSHYDLLIDLQGNIKSAIITKFAHAEEKIGTTFSSAPEWPNALFLTHRYSLNQKEPITLQYLSLIQNHLKVKPGAFEMDLSLEISSEDEVWIASILKEGKKVMVCPGSCWENKKLSLPTWIELLKKEQAKGTCYFYFVWGLEKEKKEGVALHSQFPNSSTLLPKISIPVWQRLMSKMDLIYTVDSSALHLAATTKTPTFSFFGPSAAAIYQPPGKTHQSFQASCPYGKTFIKRCPALRTCKTGACLKSLSVEKIKI